MIRTTTIVAAGILTLAVLAESTALPFRVPIPEQGDRELATVVQGGHVVVRIHTRRITTEASQELYSSGLGGGRWNQIQQLEAAFNGTRLLLPASTFCDLTNVRDAELSGRKGGVVLTLSGGDAAESYRVKIVFDRRSVIRRTVESLLVPGLLEDSRYYFRELKDVR